MLSTQVFRAILLKHRAYETLQGNLLTMKNDFKSENGKNQIF